VNCQPAFGSTAQKTLAVPQRLYSAGGSPVHSPTRLQYSWVRQEPAVPVSAAV
jgi:hypothetical protein